MKQRGKRRPRKSLTWAALAGLVGAAVAGTAVAACSTASTTGGGGGCGTDKLPPTDPCYMKGCCDSVKIGPDGGVVPDDSDAGPFTQRVCGACNG